MNEFMTNMNILIDLYENHDDDGWSYTGIHNDLQFYDMEMVI